MLPTSPKWRPEDAQNVPNGDQNGSKMGSKQRPGGLCWNGGQHFRFFWISWSILGAIWEPVWCQKLRIQKYIRKSVPKKYGKSWPTAQKTMPKCDQMVTQNRCKIGMCDFFVFYESAKQKLDFPWFQGPKNPSKFNENTYKFDGRKKCAKMMHECQK